jgi:predicted AlkP superfamily phosphohydrolase/phosphomutase
MNRRQFLKIATGGTALAGLGFPFLSCGRREAAPERKVVVLGLDGLDPAMVQALIAAGRAPNFKRLAEMGSFISLGTTMPALSPVAWSSFITGLTPAGHGIADFIMRDPKTYTPVFSIWEVTDPSTVVNIGDYTFPIHGGGPRNLRRGRPFWAYLTERGIPAVMIKIPTNFPAEESATRAISGMGTPDLTDAYGTFAYYTSDEFEHYPDLSGGNVFYVDIVENVVRTELIGPDNTLRKPLDQPHNKFVNKLNIPFTVYRDPSNDVARIDIQGQHVVLKRGEFSDWVRLTFSTMPVVGNLSGMVRFLLKEVHPHFRLYVTPINIDPEYQANPVTYPSSYGADLVRAIGPFWTKGLPADTKAFDYGVFNDEDYVKEAELILEERMRLFDYEWSRFRSGLFFFYVSSTDQDTHMLWRNMDKTHPMHGQSDVRFAGYLHHLYERMDQLVGNVLPAIDDDTLVIICSDHGFAQFGRQFHLNTWLKDQGYLILKQGAERKDETTYADIDWNRTAAYGLGFNGLYLNLVGREGKGIVRPDQVGELTKRLARDLEGIVDLETGRRPVTKVYQRDEIYVGERTHEMPELLVGYTPGYRHSAPSVLGGTGKPVIDINPWAWSGDHSMARDLVPGALFSSVKVKKLNPTILDLPVTILKYFGVEKPPQMVGEALF